MARAARARYGVLMPPRTSFELGLAVMLLPLRLLRNERRLVTGGVKFSSGCVGPKTQLFWPDALRLLQFRARRRKFALFEHKPFHSLMSGPFTAAVSPGLTRQPF
jgi:hypothetical protein